MVYKYSNTPLLPQFMSDPAVNAMRKEREEQTVQLTALLRTAAPSIDSASVRASVTCGTLDVQCKRARAAANSEYTRLRKELKEAAAALTYGLPNGGRAAEERDAYVAQYGCVAWTSESLEAIASKGKIVEVGAGYGQWARALRQVGADVLAYDDGSSLPSMPSASSSSSDAADGAEAAAPPASIEGVTLAVDGAVAAARHPDRALLMVAPPPGPAANRWLGSYKGSILLYAGEGRGGASADEAFFEAVERGWRPVATYALKPFPGGCEKLWILERQAGFGLAAK